MTAFASFKGRISGVELLYDLDYLFTNILLTRDSMIDSAC